MRIWVTILLVVASNSFAGFRTANTSWGTKNGLVFEYDKEEHFYGGGILYAISRQKYDPLESLFISLGANLVWELKDGFVSYEQFGKAGGEGFCIKDFFATFSGAFISFIIEYLLGGKGVPNK